MYKKLVFLLLLLILAILLSTPIFNKFQNKKEAQKQPEQKQAQSPQTNNKNVLGAQTPQIYLSASGQGYSGGGLIALASTDEPSVQIYGYNVSGTAQIFVYQATEDALLDYLTHDKDGKQIKTNPDLSKFTLITTLNHELTSGGSGNGSKLLLPIGNSGIWFLRIKYGSTTVDSFIIRSNIGVLVKEGDNEYIFWGQNFNTKRSVSDGVLKLYNLKDSRKELTTIPFDANGIAKTQLNPDADIALVQQGDDRAVVPINLRYLNTGYNYNSFQSKQRQTKYFIFTDRPIYRPGDKIYFKSVLRDDDDARYTIPTGQATVKIYDGYGDQDFIFQKNYDISADGTVAGEYDLPETSKTGYYRLAVSIAGSSQSTSSFDVEFYRKPEYSIDVTTPKTEFISGDKSSFIISGSYFSGQPLANQKVKYTIYSGDFYQYEYAADNSFSLSDDYRYGYWGGTALTQGEATLNQKGEAEVDLNTKLPPDKGKSQVFSIEAQYDNGSGNPTFSRKNVLVYAGEYGIYRKDQSYYSTKVGTKVSLPVTLVPVRNTSVANIPLNAKVHRENWIPYQDPNQKYTQYRKEEEDLSPLQAQTDSAGNTTFSFTPSKIGSYALTVSGQDSRGNTISKVFYSYVSSDDQTYGVSGQANDLTIHTDKEKYLPSDTVHFTISSATPDRDIFLSLERGRVNRYQIIHLTGKSTTLEVPLVGTDIPNIFAKVSSFSGSALDSGTANVLVSTDSKKLIVNITPNSSTFGPGDNVTVNIQTTDIGGNPVSADVALWSVDKALFELTDEKPAKIFDTFWSKRYDSTQDAHSLKGIPVQNSEMGGCFAAGTQVLMADGTTNNIEQVKSGDLIFTRENKNDFHLVKTRVNQVYQATDSGYFIINGYLKVTENHRLWVNNTWKEANLIQIGDNLTNSQGKNIKVASVEWITGKFTVYNLEVDKYHTYFAGGVWVHNQKGSPRTIFKDTAYWNPSIHTDSSGQTQVTFKLPDNLTTWVISAIGSTTNTQVGQTTKEIIVTKDVIVRPILPNIIRTGDNLVVSAIIQNFTNTNHTFDTNLQFDSGNVNRATQSGITIKANDSAQVYWQITPTKENDNAKLTFSAQAQDDKKASDTIVQQIPIRAFGFLEHRAETGENTKDYSVQLALDSKSEKSKITLSLSPTIVGMLPVAMKYLISYPYGCVEQTTSSFVPAVIAKTNLNLFSNTISNTHIDDIVQKGISRLSSMQQGDGGWTWWFTGPSDSFVTSYVIEYLIQAKQAGYNISPSVISSANNYLESQNPTDNQQDIITRDFALALQGINNGQRKIDLSDPKTPDYLALAVMANYLNGDKNPESNGLTKLISMAKTDGDTLFWDAGTKQHFGSKDASTALAIRAILLAEGDRSITAKAVTYLVRNRKYDYWSNTYATAQVVRALTEFSKTGNELSPNYTYSILLDGKTLSQGSVNSSNQTIEDIVIPDNQVKSGGSKISLIKSGDGQMYSTLVIDEFHTDRSAKAATHGINITREFVSDKGPNYSLAVGDTVTVKITLSGLNTNENYAVINDELPAGLIPINESFKNEQYGQNPNNYYSSYDITDREPTENGMVLSLYQVGSTSRTYTYRARVVSEGVFIVPPVTASLMYAPEIYGRSGVQQVTVTKNSQKLFSVSVREIAQNPLKALLNQPLIIIALLILVGITFVILKQRGITLVQIKEKIRNIFKRDKNEPPQ